MFTRAAPAGVKMLKIGLLFFFFFKSGATDLPETKKKKPFRSEPVGRFVRMTVHGSIKTVKKLNRRYLEHE